MKKKTLAEAGEYFGRNTFSLSVLKKYDVFIFHFNVV